MTTPEVPIKTVMGINEEIIQFTQDNGSRKYLLPFVPAAVPSVTTVIDNSLRSFGLEIWRANWIKDGLKDHVPNVLLDNDIDKILGAADKEAQRAADVGSEIHGIIDAILNNRRYDVRSQLEPAIDAFDRWRQQHPWELIGAEEGVYMWDPPVTYAGQVDAVFRDEYGNIIIVDWKSSSGIYESHLIQVAAYVYALENMLESVDGFVSNGAKQVHTPTVRGMVVRFDNKYPMRNGKKDRTQDKIFNNRIDYAWVDQEIWMPFFESVYTISKTKEAMKYVDLIRV